MPAWGQHILDAFYELSAQRASGMGGPSALTWADVGAWVGLTGACLDTDEVRMIFAMDRAYRGSVAENRPKPKKTN